MTVVQTHPLIVRNNSIIEIAAKNCTEQVKNTNLQEVSKIKAEDVNGIPVPPPPPPPPPPPVQQWIPIKCKTTRLSALQDTGSGNLSAKLEALEKKGGAGCNKEGDLVSELRNRLKQKNLWSQEECVETIVEEKPVIKPAEPEVKIELQYDSNGIPLPPPPPPPPAPKVINPFAKVGSSGQNAQNKTGVVGNKKTPMNNRPGFSITPDSIAEIKAKMAEKRRHTTFQVANTTNAKQYSAPSMPVLKKTNLVAQNRENTTETGSKLAVFTLRKIGNNTVKDADAKNTNGMDPALAAILARRRNLSV